MSVRSLIIFAPVGNWSCPRSSTFGTCSDPDALLVSAERKGVEEHPISTAEIIVKVNALEGETTLLQKLNAFEILLSRFIFNPSNK